MGITQAIDHASNAIHYAPYAMYLPQIVVNAPIQKEMDTQKSAMRNAFAAQDTITIKIVRNANYAKNYARNALEQQLTALYAII
jgi:hypothetical protein